MEEVQIFNELEFDSNHCIKLLYEYFNTQQLKNHCKENDIPYELGINLLIQMSLHNVCNIETLVGLLDINNNPQETANNLIKCIKSDLVDYSTDSNLFFVRYIPNEDILTKIKEFIYPLPMLVDPEDLTFNGQSPYKTYNTHRIMGHKMNRHNDDICLDHLNRVNKIALSLDENVISTCKNKWKVNKEETKKSLGIFMKTVNDIYQSLLIHGNKFYLSHKYDKRGRTYCEGYHISYMGNQYQKACISLTRKEKIRHE